MTRAAHSNLLDHLRATPFFAGLDDATLQALARPNPATAIALEHCGLWQLHRT